MIPAGAFPRLRPGNHRITSPVSPEYNCIAWAAGDKESWWWPDPDHVAYWPPGIPRVETVAAFVSVFQSLGYRVCEDAELEDGFEKVAIYALAGRPTHAARQLVNGRRTSKLGRQEDIEHEPGSLDGPVYGTTITVLHRSLSREL
jgi:hypothetical protein